MHRGCFSALILLDLGSLLHWVSPLTLRELQSDPGSTRDSEVGDTEFLHLPWSVARSHFLGTYSVVVLGDIVANRCPQPWFP